MWWKFRDACPARQWPAVLLVGSGLLAVAVSAGSAQDALVLSGGGSRGLAHAGAIAGLERRGFQPVLVVGTSMGAIIGALYAAGVPPDSLWSLVRRQDWQELFSMPAVSVGPQWDARRPIVHHGLGVDRDRFAEGLVADWRVNRLLVSLFFDAAARARGDFDALPRRYRAVATDLRTGEPVVLGSGDLAQAVRASMAVPGIFAPVLLDGKALVDGGIADYLPVGPARAAGAKRVVAVDVIVPPPAESREPLPTVLRALRLTLRNARRDTGPPDVAVTPAIDPELLAAVFLHDPLPLLNAGLRAALEAPTLDGPGGARPPHAPPVRLATLTIQTNDSTLLPLLRRTLDPLVGGAYDPRAVLAAIDRLYASGVFAGIWPSIANDGEGDALVVRADAVPPRIASLAAGYDNDRGFRAWASLQRRTAGIGDIVLAGNAGAIEKWASLSLRSTVTAAPGLRVDAGAAWGAKAVRIFDGGALDGDVDIERVGGWLGLRWNDVSPGYRLSGALRADYIDDGARRGSAAGPFVRVAGDRKHARVVGMSPSIEAEWRAGDLGYRRIEAAGSIDAGRGGAVAAIVATAAAVAGDVPLDVLPALGDDRGMPGLRWGEERGKVRVLAGLDGALPAPLEAFARLRVRTGAVASGLDGLADVRWLTGAEAGVLWWTPFGRLAIDLGANTRGDWRLTVDVGPRF